MTCHFFLGTPSFLGTSKLKKGVNITEISNLFETIKDLLYTYSLIFYKPLHTFLY